MPPHNDADRHRRPASSLCCHEHLERVGLACPGEGFVGVHRRLQREPVAGVLAAMDHPTRAVLAQTDVAHTTGEIARFQPLLDGLDLAGRVLTALAIGILRARGHRNIAAALRRNARDATRVLPLLGITSP